MPPVLDPNDVYAADRPDKLSAGRQGLPVAGLRPQHRVRHRLGHRPEDVPGHRARSRSAPAAARRAVLGPEDAVGQQRPAATPSPPSTRAPARLGKPVDVHDPYNLYFTPDGKYADRHGLPRPRARLPRRAHHERAQDRAGQLLRRQPRRLLPRRPLLHRLLRVQRRAAQGRHRADEGDRPAAAALHGAMPQDVKISPDGRTFYVADMVGRRRVDPRRRHSSPGRRFLPTGKGAHGLYVSRDSRDMYISNRGEGTISLFDFAHEQAHREVAPARRRQPRHGRRLRRRQGPVAVGPLQRRGVRHRHPHRHAQLARIRSAAARTASRVYPQPGRYSLGHTGIFR